MKLTNITWTENDERKGLPDILVTGGLESKVRCYTVCRDVELTDMTKSFKCPKHN